MKPDAFDKNGLAATPAEKNPPAAEIDGCGAAPWKPTVRERIARFIFPRRTVGEIPIEAMSPAVKWGSGDVLTMHVWADVSFRDLLRLLCSRRLLIEVRTATELMPGHTVSRSAISVLPPQFLEPGPSGNWSPEDERDLFALVAGVGGEAPEHPCAECHHPDCFKGYLPGRFGEPGMGDACPECLAAGRIDFRDEPPGAGWKMTPAELRAVRDQYRILEPGETIQDGDEWRPSENADWIPCAGGAGWRVSEGLFRRPVQGGIGLFEAAQNARALRSDEFGAADALRRELDGLTINSDNIGALRARYLLSEDSEWNALVRHETAAREGKPPRRHLAPDTVQTPYLEAAREAVAVGLPSTELNLVLEGVLMKAGDIYFDGRGFKPVPVWWQGVAIGEAQGDLPYPVFRGVPLGEPAGVEGEEGRPE